MKFKSKVDAMYTIIVWSVVIGMALITVVSPVEVFQTMLLLTLAINGLLLWIYYGTYYEFHDQYLYARSGPMVERLYYDRITEIKLTTSLLSSLALSKDRILIRTTRKGLAGLTYISPVEREEFLADLKSRCYNMKG